MINDVFYKIDAIDGWNNDTKLMYNFFNWGETIYDEILHNYRIYGDEINNEEFNKIVGLVLHSIVITDERSIESNINDGITFLFDDTYRFRIRNR